MGPTAPVKTLNALEDPERQAHEVRLDPLRRQSLEDPLDPQSLVHPEVLLVQQCLARPEVQPIRSYHQPTDRHC